MLSVAIHVLQSVLRDQLSSFEVHGPGSSIECVSGAPLDAEHGNHRIILNDSALIVVWVI